MADNNETVLKIIAILRIDIDSEEIRFIGVIAAKYQSLLCEGRKVMSDFPPDSCRCNSFVPWHNHFLKGTPCAAQYVHRIC